MYSGESWGLEIEPDVYRTTKRWSPDDKRRVFDAVRMLAENPYAGDIEKLKGEENRWRRRIGAYRIFYRVYQQNRKVLVVQVKRRGSHTY